MFTLLKGIYKKASKTATLQNSIDFCKIAIDVCKQLKQEHIKKFNESQPTQTLNLKQIYFESCLKITNQSEKEILQRLDYKIVEYSSDISRLAKEKLIFCGKTIITSFNDIKDWILQWLDYFKEKGIEFKNSLIQKIQNIKEKIQFEIDFDELVILQKFYNLQQIIIQKGTEIYRSEKMQNAIKTIKDIFFSLQQIINKTLSDLIELILKFLFKAYHWIQQTRLMKNLLSLAQEEKQNILIFINYLFETSKMNYFSFCKFANQGLEGTQKQIKKNGKLIQFGLLENKKQLQSTINSLEFDLFLSPNLSIDLVILLRTLIVQAADHFRYYFGRSKEQKILNLVEAL